MGQNHGLYCRFYIKRFIPDNAGGAFESYHQGKTRFAEHLRMSGVQDQTERSDLRVDVQSEDKTKTVKMGFGRRSNIAKRIIYHENNVSGCSYEDDERKLKYLAIEKKKKFLINFD